MMYQVLDKDIIENEIVPNLPKPKRGFFPKAPLAEIVNCILYKLKTGVQWAYLPVKSLFEENVLSYQSVFYHFLKWCLRNIWQVMKLCFQASRSKFICLCPLKISKEP